MPASTDMVSEVVGNKPEKEQNTLLTSTLKKSSSSNCSNVLDKKHFVSNDFFPG